MELPLWVYIIIALSAGLLGNQFVGRLIEQRFKHTWGQEQADRDREATRDKADRERGANRAKAGVEAQGRLLEAIIGMVETQSRDLTDLLRDSLKSNQTMAGNISQLAMAMEGQGRDDQNRFVTLKDSLERVRLELKRMSSKLDLTNDYTAAIIRAMGANLDAILADVANDKNSLEEKRGE